MTTASVELQGIYAVAFVPEGILTFLKSNGVLAPIDLGILAASEDLVQSGILGPIPTAGIEGLDASSMSVKTVVTKTCVLARQTMKIKETRATQGPEVLELPIPEHDEKDIKAKWKSRHDLVLGNDRLLIPTLHRAAAHLRLP